jgi:hypothetical protein
LHNQLKITKITTMQDEKEICQYCDCEVELLEVVYTPMGNRALIRFEDGREDEVPLGTLHFL